MNVNAHAELFVCVCVFATHRKHKRADATSPRRDSLLPGLRRSPMGTLADSKRPESCERRGEDRDTQITPLKPCGCEEWPPRTQEPRWGLFRHHRSCSAAEPSRPSVCYTTVMAACSSVCEDGDVSLHRHERCFLNVKSAE